MVATALDMRYRTHDLLASLSRGVQVVITYRGKKTGILSPYREEKVSECGHVRNHPFFASALDDATSVDDKMNRLRGGRFADRRNRN
jgi:antitoxin (DNA-binding transcriptional repressor) of toxin-antitoxin stability system